MAAPTINVPKDWPWTEAEVLAVLGDAEDDRRRHAIAKANLGYMRSHWEEIKREHPGQWIAVYWCRIAHAADTVEELIAMLRQDPSIPPGSAQPWFVPAS